MAPALPVAFPPLPDTSLPHGPNGPVEEGFLCLQEIAI